MAEIRKRYLTKFPREVIEEAHRVFLERLGDNAKLSFAEWHITRGDEQLTLDSENEFYYGYRDEIDDASLKYTYTIERIIYIFSVAYSKSSTLVIPIQIIGKSNIIISLNSQEDVKLVFSVFDENYLPPKEDVQPKTADKANERPKYSVEKQIPSCHVDKNLLIRLEEYIKKIGQDKGYSGFTIKLIDSNGTEELPSMENFTSEYFPNDIRKISISCGNYQPKMSMNFDRKKDRSTLELSIIGDQARENASRISAEITRILEDYKTRNYIFHLIPIEPLIFITIMGFGFASLLVSRSFGLTFVTIGGIVLIMEIIYKIFSIFNTYTTFKTKRYESYVGWKNWLTFAFIEFVLFSAIGGIILNLTSRKVQAHKFSA